MATVLDDPIDKARGYAFEFGMDLANHLPMVLWAMRRLGGSVEDAERFTHHYLEENKLAAVRPSPGPIEPDRWDDHVGDRAYEGAYRTFFVQELKRLDEDALLRHYLPRLAPGLPASALHALMRLAYAFDAKSTNETAQALAYWATTYLHLGGRVGGKPQTNDPVEVLGLIAQEPAFRGIEPERDLLWEFMRSMAQKPEFEPVYNWLAIDAETIPKMAHGS
ncbi:MAG: questin oxidase family protein, partial [Pseudomonadota bacterium]